VKQLHPRYLPTPEAISRAAATDLHGLLARRVDLSIPFGIALSGGRIAKSFYAAIVEATSRAPVSFDDVHFFWADERCVPPSSAESNYAVASENLFQPLEIPEENIHRIQGEAEAAFAATNAEAEICRILPLNAEGQPILDLVILGMGEDGHIASLFPSEPPEMMRDRAVYRRVIAAKPPPERITLGYQPILAAREVWILASGDGKREAYTRVLQADRALPASRIIGNRDETRIFQDIQAPPESSMESA
jgi:6-phosphogluconolactonase